jgi:hypothetical protein
MGGYKDRDLQKYHGVNGRVKGGKSSERPRHRWEGPKREIFRKTTTLKGRVEGGKSSGRPRHRWEGAKKEIFRKTKT